VLTTLLQRPADRPKGDNGSWLHDRAPPNGPRARGPATRDIPALPAAAGSAPQTKLMVSNLHYEIMPKDLTVRVLHHFTQTTSSFMNQFVGYLLTFIPGHLQPNRHARARALDQGLSHPPRTAPFSNRTPTRLLPPFPWFGKYDNSGRSTGVGIVHFETAGEATRAKNQFNGILAKGELTLSTRNLRLE
jgi:THO complex subunit 4